MEMGIAILRKVIFIVLLLISYEVIDRGFLGGFDTATVLKNDPKAIALLLGLLAVAVALA
ncbi:MAG: hypothetical protein ABSD56_00635 [Bryobacteraceae bacterium]